MSVAAAVVREREVLPLPPHMYSQIPNASCLIQLGFQAWLDRMEADCAELERRTAIIHDMGGQDVVSELAELLGDYQAHDNTEAKQYAAKFGLHKSLGPLDEQGSQSEGTRQTQRLRKLAASIGFDHTAALLDVEPAEVARRLAFVDPEEAVRIAREVYGASSVQRTALATKLGVHRDRVRAMCEFFDVPSPQARARGDARS